MSTDVFLVAHPQKAIFEIGGSFMHDLPEEALVDKASIQAEIQRRLPDRSEEYRAWLRDQMWSLVEAADFNVSLVFEGGTYDSLRECGYNKVGTYFPLR